MNKLSIYAATLVFSTVVYSACNVSFSAESINKIVAVVGQDIITSTELSEKTDLVIKQLSAQNISLPPRKVLEHQVLNKMILDQVQLQLAKQLAIEVDSTSVTQAIEDLAKQHDMTVSEYKKNLQKTGMNFEDFRENIKTELTTSRLQQREVYNDIKISSADIDGYLNSAAGQDNSGTEYNLGHILIVAPENVNALKKAESKAIAIVQELKQGKDFKQLAMANSADLKALNGGDLGWRQINEIPTIFVKQVPTMNINEVIGPIQSASGYHIIKLYNKRSGKKQDYTELKARQILIKLSSTTSDQDAKNILLKLHQQIINGADFGKLAEKKSEELHTASKGGDLGWINATDVLPEFWNNINNLKINEISEPFKTNLGWHLVQINNRRDSDHSQDAMRHRATEILKERKFNEMLEIWLKKIRDDAKINILL